MSFRRGEGALGPRGVEAGGFFCSTCTGRTPFTPACGAMCVDGAGGYEDGAADSGRATIGRAQTRLADTGRLLLWPSRVADAGCGMRDAVECCAGRGRFATMEEVAGQSGTSQPASLQASGQPNRALAMQPPTRRTCIHLRPCMVDDTPTADQLAAALPRPQTTSRLPADDTAQSFAISRLITAADAVAARPRHCDLARPWEETVTFPSPGLPVCPRAPAPTSGWNRPSSANTCPRPR